MGKEFTMRKSDGVRVHRKKERWMRVDYGKKRDGVRVNDEK